jgi:hypothetical protein
LDPLAEQAAIRDQRNENEDDMTANRHRERYRPPVLEDLGQIHEAAYSDR